MPKAVTEPAIFNEDYPIVGRLKSDRHSVPYFNSSETLSILPGEPVLRPYGGAEFWVCMAQSRIAPKDVKTVLLEFNAVFPCNFSGDVKDGDEVYWNPDDTDSGAFPGGRACLLAEAGSNGFLLGHATFSLDAMKPQTADEGDYPVVATAASTEVQVVSSGKAITVVGS
jgi:hypothetical protein